MSENFRGYAIKWDGERYLFSDTGRPTADTWQDRPCGYCGEHNTPEGHDACLGTVIGVMNACCGHGQTNEAYVQFWDSLCIRGNDGLSVLRHLKQHS